MLSLFNRRPTRVRPDYRVRLGMESLDQRIQPAGTTPVIKQFVALEVSNGYFIISGKVDDDQPAGLTVTFGGGIPGLDEHHATTASDGSFSFSVFVGVNQGGMVTATVLDGDRNTSPEVEYEVHPTGSPEAIEDEVSVP